MNLRNVLRAYSHLRQLTDDEAALLATLRAMTDTDRDLLVESLSPVKPAGKKAAKKPATTREYDHCLRCGTTKRDSSHKDQASPDYHEFQSSLGKSARAVSLAEQIKGTGKAIRCVREVDDNGGLMPCDALADSLIHNKDAGYLGYHEFQPPQQAAAASAATGTNDIS